ncbi:MAG: C13 family peptidase [Gemmatimonadales bacterium]
MKHLILAGLLGTVQPTGEVTQLLVVTGLSGEPSYAATLSSIGRTLVTAAKERWGLTDSSIIYLAEQHAPAAGTTGRSDRDGVIAAVTRLGASGGGNGVTLIVLAGHGSEQAGVARLNLPGPDLTAPELAMALEAFGRRTVVIVNAASASGGFLEPLAASNRIVITATKTANERNATRFGEYFAKGLTSDEADADKNGRVAFAEAYRYARNEVVRSYQAARRLLTEHSQLDDNGDGTGSAEPGPTDGAIASAISLPLKPEERSADPRVAALLAERRRLEGAVAALRGRKAAMDSVAYERELERLVLELAETNQAIRSLRGTP